MSGIDGFLGTRASIMLDVVFAAMFAVIPILAVSIYQVRVRRRYQLHKRIQLTLAAVLLVAVGLFEIDIRVNGWRHRAEASRYYGGPDELGLVFPVLYVHLTFAVSTFFLWLIVLVRALRNFPNPPVPGPHSQWHRFWGRLAAIDMTLTAITGWTFYWLAFVC